MVAASAGNILRHGYDIVDPRRIWDLVQLDLAAFGVAIGEIMTHSPPGNSQP
jgi:uncharacterized protein with HEPN domain